MRMARLLEDVTKAHFSSKRVFLLGPSHHWGLPGAATTACSEYGTPLGNLTVDTELVETIRKDWNLKTMSRQQDEDEHSLEMHLPYIYKMLSLCASIHL
jgi:AmmeMemoRadiSam system protein B